MRTIDTMSVARSSSARMTPVRAPFSLVDVWRWFNGRMAKARSRRALSELTDEQLRDIGLTRRDARNEALRPFWN